MAAETRFATFDPKGVTTDQVLSQLGSICRAFVDASSIIYMHKADFLEELAGAVKLYSPREIIAETGYNGLPVCPVTCPLEVSSNDERLIVCALAHGQPVISEDKKVLSYMDKEGVPYFNALMMLHLLLFRKVVSEERHLFYLQELKRVAWYSKSVLQFAEAVYHAIVPCNRGRGLKGPLPEPLLL
jgi:hypothetical protein